jgi:hypothetical protein
MKNVNKTDLHRIMLNVEYYDRKGVDENAANMRLQPTAQLAAKNNAASLASLASRRRKVV